MTPRLIACLLIAIAVSTVIWSQARGAALPANIEMAGLPVQGSVLPAGDFVGTLQIVACTLDAAGQLRLTGMLTGTAVYRTSGNIPVTRQPFTAPATLRDPGHTTDVVHLVLGPIVLDPNGIQIRLDPITVDIESLPQVGDELATYLPSS